MLILTRHVNERIVVSGPGGLSAWITVVSIQGQKVRLGIEADPAVAIHREEVWKQIQEKQDGDRSSDDGHTGADAGMEGNNPTRSDV